MSKIWPSVGCGPPGSTSFRFGNTLDLGGNILVHEFPYEVSNKVTHLFRLLLLILIIAQSFNAKQSRSHSSASPDQLCVILTH